MKLARLCFVVFAFLALTALTAHADILGSAYFFGVLAGSAVTNTGPTVITGDLGVYPGTSISGFPPGIVNGTIHDADAVAQQAQADALTAYNYFAGLPFNQNLTGQDLGGLTLTPGVYFYSSSAQLTGTLTLDFQGMNNADIILQIGSALTAAGSVMAINLGTNDNVFWQIGSSAFLGATTAFQGTIIADQSITLDTGATIDCGRAIALNGAVTMDNNTINNCAGTGSVPESGTIGLLATAGAIAVGARSTNFAFWGLGGSITALLRKRKR